MPINNTKQQGPDPAVLQAIQRLAQTQLDPLQEVIFKSWLEANQIEDADNPETPFDWRGLYQQTGGKVFAPGELSGKVNHQNAIQMLMQAQEQHDASSPMRLLQEAGGNAQALGMGLGQPGGSSASPDPGMSADPGMGGADMSSGPGMIESGGFDNSGESF
jgi:hypothetical protein